MKDSVGWRRWLLFWTIALGGAAFDLTTKAVIFQRIGQPPAPPVSVIADILELRTSYNPGALWGLGRGWAYSSLIFAALSVVAAVAICWYLFVRNAATNGPLTVALALIMAGALGNCYDRLVLGHVRDFAHFHIDPIGFNCAIFNFADNMLVAGAIALMIVTLRSDPMESLGPDGGSIAGDEAGRPFRAKPAETHGSLESSVPSV